MDININDIKCIYKKGAQHTTLDMSKADNRNYRDLLIAVVIAFERVKEKAPKFVVFNDTLPDALRVLVFRADVNEEDLDMEWFRLTAIQKDLDEQAKANAREDEEPWVKFEVL